MELLLKDESYPLNLEAYEEWLEYRRTERKPAIPKKSEKRVMKRFQLYTPEVQALMVKHSTDNLYQGLFPEKFCRDSQPSNRTRDSSFEHDLTNRDWAR